MDERERTIEELKAELEIARAYAKVLCRTRDEAVSPPDQPMDAEDHRLQIRTFEDELTVARIVVRDLQKMVLGVRDLLDAWEKPDPTIGRLGPPQDWQRRISKLLVSDYLGWPGNLPEWSLETDDGEDVTETSGIFGPRDY